MTREEFARKFIEDAKRRGKSKEETEQKFIEAMRLYDQKYAQQETSASREASDKNLLENLGNFFAKNITSTGQLAARGLGLKQQLPEVQAQITQLGQQSRDLIAQARTTNDPVEKQKLLEQSRQINDQIDRLGAGIEQQAETMIDRGNISEADLERSNLEFAARRGAATGLEAGSILAPFVLGPAPAAGSMSKVARRGLEGAVTGGLAGAAESAAQAESLKEAAGKTAFGTGVGAASDVIVSGAMDFAADTTFKTFSWTKDTLKKLFKKNPKIDEDKAVGTIQQEFQKIFGKGGIKDRMLVSQTMAPRHALLERGLIEEGEDLGVNETINFIANLDMPPDPKLLFGESIKQKKEFPKIIEKFLKENADDLPPIDMEKVASEALDDEIYQAIRLDDESAFNTLVNFRERVSNKGQTNFGDAYQLAKDYGEKARDIYRLDKKPNEVQVVNTRSYTLLNNKLRATLSEAAETVGHPEWSPMMNNYHQWSIVKEIATSVLADRQGKIGSIKNFIFSRLLPMALVNDKLQYAALGGVAGLSYGAVTSDESMAGGLVKGTAAGLVLPGIAGIGKTTAPFAARGAKKALQYLTPQTGRSMLQQYLGSNY